MPPNTEGTASRGKTCLRAGEKLQVRLSRAAGPFLRSVSRFLASHEDATSDQLAAGLRLRPRRRSASHEQTVRTGGAARSMDGSSFLRH